MASDNAWPAPLPLDIHVVNVGKLRNGHLTQQESRAFTSSYFTDRHWRGCKTGLFDFQRQDTGRRSSAYQTCATEVC